MREGGPGKPIRSKEVGFLLVETIDLVKVEGPREWRKPTHDDFQPRSAWSPFDAGTEAMKGINPNLVAHHTQAFHGLFDGLVGLS